MTLPDRLVDAAIAQGHQDPWLTVHVGDCREVLRSLPERSVHTVVTSPPYWGLRDYGHAGQLGLEATPEEYVANMVAVFREVRRVLRDDGTLWLNLGDSYANDGKWGGSSGGKHVAALHGHTGIGRQKVTTGLKPKDLVGIPWRVAFALQADGWYLRSDIIWAKPNPMPESVTDRPTKAHEYLFLLAKAPRYFYDADAVREDYSGPMYSGRDNGAILNGDRADKGKTIGMTNPAGRNRRSVWTVATQPYPGAHFATFPPKLIEPCILAGTSERGVCPDCGAPWERVVERGDSTRDGPTGSGWRESGQRGAPDKVTRVGERTATTTGWRPTCAHDGEPVPAVVLDPFGGSGTVAVVAQRHRRRAVLIELNPEYADQSVVRASRSWGKGGRVRRGPKPPPDGSWVVEAAS